eukprot:CAMPEP_0178916638 /NCGR_PEP_ID=MMETSP0786-20121207/12766_1 /TAXON_ID=186022 /ORGANISM="Thalassionema frauenfeldii, Strain CCMP 1798" /LENGTH=520 /DNA_ID=CAMNT_0020590027 /DNA_START=31 /DNA_END=1593 /DNA_ORIENTATION=+
MNNFLSTASKKISQAGENARKASITNLNHATSAMGLTVSEEKFRKSLEPPIRHSGKVWKRRGGLLNGKIASNIIASSWDERHLELRGSTLIYYDLEGVAPRGILDLREENAFVQASLGHTSGGAPSPFCISIKVTVGLAQETKWKLCFEKHSEQIKWLDMMSQVIVESSVDSYNHALLEAANPKSPKASELSQWIRSPPTSSEEENDMDTSGGGHGLWMLVGEESGRFADDILNFSMENETTSIIDEQLALEQVVKALRDKVSHLRDSLQKSEQALNEKTQSNEALALEIKNLQEKCDKIQKKAFEVRAQCDESLLQANAALTSAKQEFAKEREKIDSEKRESNAKLESTISSVKDQLEKKDKMHQDTLQNAAVTQKRELDEAKKRAKEEEKQLRTKFETEIDSLREELNKKKAEEKVLLEKKSDQEKSILNATTAMLSMQEELNAVKKQSLSEKVQMQSDLNATIESLRRELVEKEVSHRESTRALQAQLACSAQESQPTTLEAASGDCSDDEFQDCIM